ncbi:MAG: universal stress protein [Buchananella hordeovulneris]|nr:universal stress protein [Buchananella hordeovulneris]
MSILLAYHGTDESNAALEAAIGLVESLGQELVVLVARRQSEDDPRTVEGAEDQVWDRLESADIRFKVRHARADLQIGDDILAAVEELSPSLVVIGLRGRTHGSSLGMGVNAAKVLLEAPVPVLTVTSR